MLRSNIHSYDDALRQARRRLPWLAFDYIDGCAGTEYGEALNRRTLQEIRLQPRVLRDVRGRDLGVDVLGTRAKVPFGIAPMGMCNLAGPGSDLLLAKMAARHTTPIGVSTVASTSLETMIEVAEGHAWFQLYFSGDGSGAAKLVDRAEAAGYDTLIVTMDVPEIGRRPRELRRDYRLPFKIGPMQFLDFALHLRWSLATLLRGKPDLANFQGPGNQFVRGESRAGADWGYLKRLRDRWPGKIVAKGVLNVEDAAGLKAMGIDAVQVSSHGGRQLDSAVPPILALRAIRAEVGPEYPLFYDSGLRSGEDVIRAYAMGASFAFIGRPLLYGMAANRAQGLEQIWDVLLQETGLTLAQLGRKDMANLSGTLAPDWGQTPVLKAAT